MRRFLVPVRLKAWAVCGALLVAISGCGKSGPEIPELFTVSGKVTFEGKPVPGAKVVFIAAKEDPKKPPQLRPSAEADDEGNYTLMWGDNEGAPEGSYKVIIMAFKEHGPDDDTETRPPSLIPDRYNSPGSSGLTAVVKEDDENVVNFDLVP